MKPEYKEVAKLGHLVAYQFMCKPDSNIHYGIIFQSAFGTLQAWMPKADRDGGWLTIDDNTMDNHLLEIRVPYSDSPMDIFKNIDKVWDKSSTTWTKETVVELTMDEIAKKFGIKNVKNLKIKE